MATASDSEMQVRATASSGSSGKATSQLNVRALPPKDASTDGNGHRGLRMTPKGAAPPPPVAVTASIPSSASAVNNVATTQPQHSKQVRKPSQQQAAMVHAPSGTSTPQMWRLGSATPQVTAAGSYQPHVPLQPGVGHGVYTAGPPVVVPAAMLAGGAPGAQGGQPVTAIQGLASWPTAWVPPTSPVPSAVKVSLGIKHQPVAQILHGSRSVNSSPAAMHRPVTKVALQTQASWSMMNPPTSRTSLAPLSPPVAQRAVSKVGNGSASSP